MGKRGCVPKKDAPSHPQVSLQPYQSQRRVIHRTLTCPGTKVKSFDVADCTLGAQLLKVLEHLRHLDGMKGSSSAMVFGPLGLQQT